MYVHMYAFSVWMSQTTACLLSYPSGIYTQRQKQKPFKISHRRWFCLKPPGMELRLMSNCSHPQSCILNARVARGHLLPTEVYPFRIFASLLQMFLLSIHDSDDLVFVKLWYLYLCASPGYSHTNGKKIE